MDFVGESILSIRNRASCFPESSRRALVADAMEDSQDQMHSLLTPGKRGGLRVRRASVLCDHTPTLCVFVARLVSSDVKTSQQPLKNQLVDRCACGEPIK